MTGTPASTGDVEILLFDVAGWRYGADAAQVLRVDLPGAHASPLAPARSSRRALVFEASNGAMNKLQVDAVHGVRTIPVEQLRQLPSGISPRGFAIGVWLDGDAPVLLVDLPQMVKQIGGQ
ncbi:MAG TPA: chemotaxis protein CheW [Myxococcaceae bacterium]|nr:chemotaxis protein CheW [Myxococcaceae bacterium]